MTYIENIFLCLALPMLLSLLFTSGSPRRFTLFVVLGMATCLLSAYVSSFFMGRHQCSAVTTAIEIAPVCEEILKLLPLLLYFLIFEPDSHKLTPAAIGIAVGFATFENVCYLTENGAGSFVFLLIRGMSAGALHLVCGILTGLALAYVFRRPWLTCTGTVGILGVCMVLHGIYNLLITADGFWQMVGYFFPLPSSLPCLRQGCSTGAGTLFFTDRFPLFSGAGNFFELFSNLGERNRRELYYRR